MSWWLVNDIVVYAVAAHCIISFMGASIMVAFWAPRWLRRLKP